MQSTLERRWLRAVERPHGLARSARNCRQRDDGAVVYRDVEFPGWGLVVQLDGQEYHALERFRDRRRDNRVVVTGRQVLRYGWQDVVEDPCGVAAEVAGVLRSRGWSGELRPCGPACRAGV